MFATKAAKIRLQSPTVDGGFEAPRPPVNFASIERFGVEGDGGRVATLDTADGDFSAQFHPGHGEDGAGVGAGQREDVLFVMLQQT